MPSNKLDGYFGFTSFGESHGPAIGLVIDSPPPNLDFPHDALEAALARRNISTPYKTARNESDDYEILSGVFEGKTTGMPLCIIVRNHDARSLDYEAFKNVFRPGHADFAWYEKYHIYDYRGGGRASGRETLTRVIAASFAKDIINPITIETRCLQIGDFIADPEGIWEENPFAWSDKASLSQLYDYLDKVKVEGDSVGGIIELKAMNVPAGLGDPVYDKLSANIAKAMLSIPSVKGISFGDGEALASMKGSMGNDQISRTGFLSNHQGGINGGVSNGNDLRLRLIIRAVPSVSNPQRTIDKAGKDHIVSIQGRHDVCHIPRLIPVAEAMLKLCLADAIQHQKLISGEEADLSSYRESLDKLDEDLILLLYRRKKLVEQVKAFKKEHQLSPRDEDREREIIARSRDLGRELDLDEDIVSRIMHLVLQSSQ